MKRGKAAEEGRDKHEKPQRQWTYLDDGAGGGDPDIRLKKNFLELLETRVERDASVLEGGRYAS